MTDAGPQAPAAPAPQGPQALQQPAQQAQCVPQLNWPHLSQNFQENQKIQRHICSEQTIGWTNINFKRV